MLILINVPMVRGAPCLLSENNGILPLKVPIMTAADDIHKYFSLFFGENKT